ncbi:hypothetical protein GH811_02715 [Acetobacterium malicum]|uniref:Uncharacterized protein n=1 Tax=Acetobacterium malicum TaxID=52692 RepID=A0ABR6YTN1_9FIRM|nr:DUF960 family protein [Acetobacterium malicum]MBC3898529.1 hypothetical protein [Acetobacterium malicum]
MFNNQAYMTKGFQSEIPAITQVIIFDCLEKSRHTLKSMDDLQIFELKKIRSNGTDLQEILHKQEIPTFEETIVLELPEDQIINKKVYVIDDGDHHTFLLASEY